jgi:hypothetical protein
MLKLIVVSFSLVYFGSQLGTSQETVEYGEPTRFELSAEKTTYWIAEPVNLSLKLFNDQSKPIKGYFNIGLVGRGKVYYRKVGGEFTRYYPHWLHIFVSGYGIELPIVISGHGKEEAAARLFYNSVRKEFVLAGPGEYEFKATFYFTPRQGKEREYESNIVRVKVVEPPEEERAALAALSDPVLASFVEGDLQLDVVEDAEVEAGAEKAARFLEKYSGSIYAPLVEEQLREVLTRGKATIPGRLTPKLKAIKDSLPDR